MTNRLLSPKKYSFFSHAVTWWNEILEKTCVSCWYFRSLWTYKEREFHLLPLASFNGEPSVVVMAPHCNAVLKKSCSPFSWRSIAELRFFFLSPKCVARQRRWIRWDWFRSSSVQQQQQQLQRQLQRQLQQQQWQHQQQQLQQQQQLDIKGNKSSRKSSNSNQPVLSLWSIDRCLGKRIAKHRRTGFKKIETTSVLDGVGVMLSGWVGEGALHASHRGLRSWVRLLSNFWSRQKRFNVPGPKKFSN